MLKEMFDVLDKLADKIRAFRKDRRELADAALRAVSLALEETSLYYQRMERGASRDQDTEAQLVKYWSAAAIPIRHIDANLAQACDCKAEYWVNPDTWPKRKIRAKGIDLATVRERYRELLRPQSFLARSPRAPAKAPAKPAPARKAAKRA